MFLHRLALELHLLVEDIQARMTLRELLDWMAYFTWRDQQSGSRPAELGSMTPAQIAAAFGASTP